ncbi:sensor histidine kinase [Deinococcus sp.]|uniref:sensor histidine kinase n=1 Tax=Deinococcus sp. TaxID=47478 RepID=UPI003C7CE0F5
MKPPADDLRRVEALADLSWAELAWLAEHSELHGYSDGDTVVHAGAPADHLFLVLDGQIEYSGEQAGQSLRYVTRQGEVAGMLPQSRMTHFASTGKAVGPTRVAFVHRSLFPELAVAVPSLETRLLAVMTRRIRDAAHAEEQRERMSALGKLSAGLAHELNNPATAVRRGADELASRISALPELFAGLLASGLRPELLARAEAVVAARRTETLGTLMQADAEDELSDLLGTLDLPRSSERQSEWPSERSSELAATFVEAGLRSGHLTWLQTEPQHAPALVAYLNFRLGSLLALQDVAGAASRIGDLVTSIKRYSHMDRGGDRQPADVRVGLDSTLTMLGHKLRGKQARVRRKYQQALPEVLANEGELNQVWTNLIDNAADALPLEGELTIEVDSDGQQVRVCVSDTGPGISPELQKRIFEPFFTTKEVGQGSGLGLDLVQRVVVRQHGGDVRVRSVPGHTTFEVRLPVRPG